MALSRLIGSRLRERRLALGLRQSDVAAAADMSASFLNLIEHNRRRVQPAALARLAEILKTTPAVLGGGDDSALLDDLRAAAVGTEAEVARIDEFLLRFPGWAKALAKAQGRAADAERAVGALNDRLTHDPYLSQALHDLVSALSSVRSTAAILAETPDIDPVWRNQFHGNLHADAERMASGAEALVSYLDGSDGDPAAGIANPQEEVDAWLAEQSWTLQQLEEGDVASVRMSVNSLASGAARVLAHAWVDQAVADVAALPMMVLQKVMSAIGDDPLRLAVTLGIDPLIVFRRMATSPGSELGLVISDGSGSLTFRKPARGFSIPRFGSACALWPLFTALRRPMQAVQQRVVIAGRTGEGRYLLQAYGKPIAARAFGGPDLYEAAMLIRPDPSQDDRNIADILAVGMTCRVCVQSDCPARREPSILSGA